MFVWVKADGGRDLCINTDYIVKVGVMHLGIGDDPYPVVTMVEESVHHLDMSIADFNEILEKANEH